MKVLFTLDSLANAGTEKSMLDIISHFSKGIQVKVIYFYPGDDLRPAYENAGIPVQLVNLTGKEFLLRGVQNLKKIILVEKPDVVVSSMIQSNLISRIACRMTGTRLIGTFVSDSYSNVRLKSFSLKRRAGFYFFYRLDRLTAHIPVAWISNSECIKESNCKFLKVNPALVKVIYRGRDPEKFIAKERFVPGNIFRFVYIGRLLQTKGLKELLEGFKLLLLNYPNTVLDIYGGGPFRNELIELIKELKLHSNVTLHGVVSNGWEKLFSANCFVFPSWYEGFSGSLVEAMMAAIPIIASDIPMNLEAVTAQKTALIHKVKDAMSIAEQMKEVMSNYDAAVQMGLQARKEALARFDIKVIARDYENYIREVSTN